jgi:hypothetical protein
VDIAPVPPVAAPEPPVPVFGIIVQSVVSYLQFTQLRKPLEPGMSCAQVVAVVVAPTSQASGGCTTPSPQVPAFIVAAFCDMPVDAPGTQVHWPQLPFAQSAIAVPPVAVQSASVAVHGSPAIPGELIVPSVHFASPPEPLSPPPQAATARRPATKAMDRMCSNMVCDAGTDVSGRSSDSNDFCTTTCIKRLPGYYRKIAVNIEVV